MAIMYAELKEKSPSYCSIDVHTHEGRFNIQYQRRDPNRQYVSLQGKTVAYVQDDFRTKFTFPMDSLSTTLEVRPTFFSRLYTLTLTVDNQVIYSEGWFDFLQLEQYALADGRWYLGVYSILAVVFILFALVCRWLLDSFLDFQFSLSIASVVVILFFFFLWLGTIISIVKGPDKINPDLLIQKVDNPHTIKFNRLQDEWEQFRSKMVEGDEIWEWASSALSWRMMAGRRGYVIVDHGQPTHHIFITGMN